MSKRNENTIKIVARKFRYQYQMIAGGKCGYFWQQPIHAKTKMKKLKFFVCIQTLVFVAMQNTFYVFVPKPPLLFSIQHAEMCFVESIDVIWNSSFSQLLLFFNFFFVIVVFKGSFLCFFLFHCYKGEIIEKNLEHDDTMCENNLFGEVNERDKNWPECL